MANYSNVTDRDNAAPLIPEEVSREIIQNVADQSAALRFFRRFNMSSQQQRVPVLAALPQAYFVSGDTGLKETTEQAWKNKFLNVEEIAAIVPIPEAVLDDSDYDLWAEIRPLVEEAVGRTLDAAIFFGTNKPASWPDDIVTAATAVSNTYTRGTNTAGAGGIAEDVNQTMALVEAEGFDISGHVTRRTYRARLRSARDTTGQKLLDVTSNSIEGAPIQYAMPGLWPSGSGATEFITGDFSQGIVGTRMDMTWKLLDQAVIQDGSGNIIYNLAQQDMVAMRVVARFAFQVPNPINYEQTDETARYPFALLLAP